MRKQHLYTAPGKYGVLLRRNFYLPQTLVADLKTIAQSQNLTYSELVRRVLSKYAARVGEK
jgi:hypothetical protein